MTYQRDTFYYPFELAGGATDGRLYIIEDTGGPPNAVGVDLVAGRWYGHADATLHAAGYKGIWHTLIDELNNNTGGDGTRTGTPTNTQYVVSVVNPSASPGYVNGGLEFRAVNATNPFQISFAGSPKTTLDPRLLGNKDPAYSAAYNSITDGPDEVVVVPNSVFGRLVTQTLAPEGRARNKRSKPFKEGPRSSSIPSKGRRVVWSEGRRRPFEYQFVYGGFVYAATDEVGFQLKVDLEAGDVNGCWEHLWDSLTESDEVIVVHNSSADLQVTTHKHDIGQLYSGDDWDSMFSKVQNSADLHHVQFILELNSEHQGYSH